MGCNLSDNDPTANDQTLWDLLDKPVRDLHGFSFWKGPAPVSSKGTKYFASGHRIYARDWFDVLNHVLFIAILVPSLLIGVKQEGNGWVKANSTFNLLITGLVAVVLFLLAGDKGSNGERSLVNGLFLRHPISEVDNMDELHCVVSALNVKADPGKYVSWPNWQLVRNHGGKTILTFDMV